MFSASGFFAVPVTKVCGFQCYIRLLICKAHLDHKRRATQHCA